MCELRQVSVRFGEKLVLDDFSRAFERGRVTCLMGPSGCGKTTLLRVAAGLIKPDAGVVRAAKGRASFVFQEDRLLPWLTALQNLTVLGIAEDTAAQVLARVGLEGELSQKPDDLSGGMRRRLAIARAMAFGGDVFFLDEPLRGLDAATAEPVLALMRETLRGKTALLVTHSEKEALALSDTLIALSGPPLRVVQAAPAESFTNEQMLKGWLDAASVGQ